MAGRKQIYVQIGIRAPIDRVWQLTQTPELHEQWDLRFSEIQYLPRPDPAKPQRFLYRTRIGFGLNIAGEGESVGTHDGPNGQRTSSLKFWSKDPKSLIREGSGYWKYEACGGQRETIRFTTGYDYSVRFGAFGRAFDRLVFRPLIGWATAWSFDRLRLWIEKGSDPAAAMRLSAIYAITRLSLAIVWLYQGVVPKLLFRHPGELAMLKAAGLSDALARGLCIAIGCGEVGIALFLLLFWAWRWPLWLTLIAMPIATLGVGLTSPSFLAAPFNPVALNLCVFALSVIALASMHDLPSAARCLRRPVHEDL